MVVAMRCGTLSTKKRNNTHSNALSIGCHHSIQLIFYHLLHCEHRHFHVHLLAYPKGFYALYVNFYRPIFYQNFNSYSCHAKFLTAFFIFHQKQILFAYIIFLQKLLRSYNIRYESRILQKQFYF